MKRNKKNKNSNSTMRSFRVVTNFILKLLAITIPLVTAGAVFFNQVYIRQSFYDSSKAVMTILEQSDTAQTNYSNEGVKETVERSVNELSQNGANSTTELLIGLFGIIISVWVGLNIYNVLKKDDYNDLLQTINDKCDEHDVIQKKVEETYSGNMEMHISYLYKTFDINNNSSQYFYSMFKDIDKANLDYIFLLNATFLETIYVKITTIHEKNEHIKMGPYILEGKQRCKEMLKWLDQNSEKIVDKDRLKGYIKYRQGRMDFYQGMMNYYAYNKKGDASNCFMDAAHKLEEAIQKDSLITSNIDIYNTLGYIYIKIYEWNINELHPTLQPSQMKDIINKALDNCLRSKHETAKSLKNLGIVYERLGRLDDAIQKYKEATTNDYCDYQSRICLASAYLKKAQETLEITTARKELLCEMHFSEKKATAALSFIEKASLELTIAQIIDNRSANYYYKKGQLLTYRYLLEKNKKKKNDYCVKAQKCFFISHSLHPTFDAHRFHERNFYEAINNIKEAQRINSKLCGLDVDNLQKLYENKTKMNCNCDV